VQDADGPVASCAVRRCVQGAGFELVAVVTELGEHPGTETNTRQGWDQMIPASACWPNAHQLRLEGPDLLVDSFCAPPRRRGW
jgi:hypothetical protein